MRNNLEVLCLATWSTLRGCGLPATSNQKSNNNNNCFPKICKTFHNFQDFPENVRRFSFQNPEEFAKTSKTFQTISKSFQKLFREYYQQFPKISSSHLARTQPKHTTDWWYDRQGRRKPKENRKTGLSPLHFMWRIKVKYPPELSSITIHFDLRTCTVRHCIASWESV